MKVCSTCGQKKPLHAFYEQKGGAQGRREVSLAMERAQDVRQRVGDSRYAKANTLQNLAVMHAMRRDFTRAHAAAVTARDGGFTV